MKSVSIIRDRGQLTIPDSVRKTLSWLNPMSAVTISVVKPDEIIIKPHQVHINQEKIWNLIKKSRAIKGKGKGSAAEFLMDDRNSH
jgi:bifunctional DNA-binding transcriptional regulator/antitoxin component of YhaV-PrlF toxin-antitoxin module